MSDSWILQPEDPWEVTGYVHNVVFSCGAVPEPDGTVKIYWGGADSVMCVGEANIADLVGSLSATQQIGDLNLRSESGDRSWMWMAPGLSGRPLPCRHWPVSRDPQCHFTPYGSRICPAGSVSFWGRFSRRVKKGMSR